jgi:hypothetical protein
MSRLWYDCPRYPRGERLVCFDTFDLSRAACLQLVEKEINCCNPTVPRNDEVSPRISRRLARATRHPLDPSAIAHFLRVGYWLISKVRHPPQSGWLDELGRLKGGRAMGLGVARCAP